MDQDVHEIDEQRDREHELQGVGEVHIRSSQAAKANIAAIETTIVNTITRSAIRLAPPLAVDSKRRFGCVRTP
jgi:hypothetical protein